MLIDHLLEIIDRNLGLIQENLIMDRTRSTLDGSMSIQVEVILIRVSDIVLDECTRKWVAVAIPSLHIIFLGEEADVVTLGTDGDGPLDVSSVRPKSLKHSGFHVVHFLINNLRELTFRDTITEVVDVLRRSTSTSLGTLDPETHQWNQHGLDVSLLNHLNTMTIGLNSCSVSGTNLVKGDSDGSHGALINTETWMRNIGTDNHGWLGKWQTSTGNLARSTSELGIDLHTDVRGVLPIILSDVIDIQACTY